MADEGGYGGVLDGGISRARFLKLAGLGSGLSLLPGSLFPTSPAAAQAVGTPELLDPARYPYPVVAWWPPPPVSNNLPDDEVNAETARRYAELAGAGFNTVIGGNGVGNERANRLALAACEQYGLRLVLADAALSNAIKGTTTTAQSAQAEGQEEPEGVLQALTEQDSQQDVRAQAAANRTAITDRLKEIYSGIEGRPGFGGRPGLAGIFLYDEPGRTQFADLRFARREVEKIFGPDELPYVNAWPSYAARESALQAPSYTEYLDSYMNGRRSISPPFLSFDHYPLLANEKTTPDFFYNHAVIRNFARRFGVPSWGFVQSMGFSGGKVGIGRRRQPDEAEIFWQINVALAYGVKGIQYFTYWTPNDPDLQSGDALITLAGDRTPLYDYAKRANDFLRKVGEVLLPLTSVSVTHFGERRLPRGAKAFKGNTYVRAASGDPAILGFFSDPGDSANQYLLVVNRSPNRASRTRLTIPGTVRDVYGFNTETGVFEQASLTGDPPRFLNVSLGAGRARLYRLRTA
jgi:hypothetical protein